MTNPSEAHAMPEGDGQENLAQLIGQLAAVMAGDGFPTGDLAALKRQNPQHPPSLVFYRFAVSRLREGWDRSPEAVKDWQTILAGMAMMCPFHHAPDQAVGKVLAENRFAEGRLARLLEADGEGRRVLTLRLARFLRAKGAPVNWTELARFLLVREESRRTQGMQRMARDYYRALRDQKQD